MARTKRVRASSEDSYNGGPTTQTATPSPPKKARTTEPAAEGTVVRKKKARNVRPGNCSNCWCNEVSLASMFGTCGVPRTSTAATTVTQIHQKTLC